MVADEVNVYLWRDGFHLLFPMRGKDHWRIVGILPPELRDRNDRDIRGRDSLAAQGGGRRTVVQGLHLVFHLPHSSPERRRVSATGRCFLLGDAAHIHSPVGAQGMNTGLQDAYNLAWKLALVVKGRADAALLDSYEEERVPVAQRLLNTTDRAFRLVVSDSWLAGLLRTKVLARIAAFAMTLRARAENRVPHRLADRHPTTARAPLSQSLAGLSRRCAARGRPLPLAAAQVARERARRGPVPATRRHALQPDRVSGSLAPASATIGIGDLLRVHAIPDDPVNDAELARVQIPQPSFYLLRPDGYIGLCGAGLEAAAVKRYLSERLRLGAGNG